MSFRPISENDLVRGVVVRINNIGIWNVATIIAANADEITLCRPMVYANEHFDSKTGMITTEVFSLSKKSALALGYLSVETNLAGDARSYLT